MRLLFRIVRSMPTLLPTLVGWGIFIVILVLLWSFGKAVWNALPQEARKDSAKAMDWLRRQGAGVRTLLAAGSQKSPQQVAEEIEATDRQIREARLQRAKQVVDLEVEQRRQAGYASIALGQARPGDEITVAVFKRSSYTPIEADLYIEGPLGVQKRHLQAGQGAKLPYIRGAEYRFIARSASGEWSQELVFQDDDGGPEIVELEIP